jgi:hypothetical protein
MEKDDWEIIEVSEETIELLNSLAAYSGETYNDVITRLINLYESRRC